MRKEIFGLILLVVLSVIMFSVVANASFTGMAFFDKFKFFQNSESSEKPAKETDIYGKNIGGKWKDNTNLGKKISKDIDSLSCLDMQEAMGVKLNVGQSVDIYFNEKIYNVKLKWTKKDANRVKSAGVEISGPKGVEIGVITADLNGDGKFIFNKATEGISVYTNNIVAPTNRPVVSPTNLSNNTQITMLLGSANLFFGCSQRPSNGLEVVGILLNQLNSVTFVSTNNYDIYNLRSSNVNLKNETTNHYSGGLIVSGLKNNEDLGFAYDGSINFGAYFVLYPHVVGVYEDPNTGELRPAVYFIFLRS